MRSIYQQVQYGNEHDEDEFQRREEKQRRYMEQQQQQQVYGKNSRVAAPETISLIDTLPIHRDDELQSRKHYYIQYTRENFLQQADVLQEMIQPIDRVRERKKNFDYSSRGRSTTTTRAGSGSTPYHMDDDDDDEGPIPHNAIQYHTQREEQYNMIQRWIHIIQQGYIHHEWLLRDMKFDTARSTSTTSSITTTSTTTSDRQRTTKRNRIHTNLSKVDVQKQREINAVQLQLQQYVDKVLQYNYNITTIPSPKSDSSAMMDRDMPSVSSREKATNIDFEWSDDDDD